ncbi:MAG: alpha-amylase family protein [Planctomycetota bacterium]
MQAETNQSKQSASELSLASRPLPTRQIHLDFHTSEHIPGIGERFSKEQWQEALKVGHVNSINIFAKGHHSWSYYPTKVGKRHPHLKFDLLGAQIEACHEIGVECPLYFTVGWSVNDAINHPEWCARKKDGSLVWDGDENAKPSDPKPYGGWKLLCPSGSYHEHIKQQVVELCESYDVDGFWFDIYQAYHGCYCDRCRERMKKNGVDVDDHEAVVGNFVEVYKEHMVDLRKTIAEHHPNATVFFNGTTSLWANTNQRYATYEHNTHQDLEDLPTGWGGYDKFPLKSQYYLNQGYQICAMSGKFHTSWGEFGGFKHPNGLKYEAASMIAFGSACNFGDQLHPSGLMDMQTYRNVGEAFKYVQQIEEYGPGSQPVANLGLWFTTDSETDQGAAKLLLETQTPFRIATRENLDTFQTLVVPSYPCLDSEDVAAIEQFVAAGGGVFFLADGAMDEDKQNLVMDVGADLLGGPRYDVDYTAASPELGDHLMTSPVVNYVPAYRVKPHPDAQVLAAVYEPYFSRTYEHFSSHKNTPQKPDPAEHPSLIQTDKVLFSAHPLDRMYKMRGAPPHRDLFEAALRRIHAKPCLEVDLPSAGRVSLLHQPDKNRYIAHLLYAAPHYRGELELIEDLVPFSDVPVKLRVPEQVKTARLIPDEQPLEIRKDGDTYSVTVPEFTMHCGVVFEY